MRPADAAKRKRHFHLARERRWFTLFLIPLFPYQSEFTLFCDSCLSGVGCYGEDIGKLLRLRKSTQLLLEHVITDREYECLLEDADIHLDDVTPKKQSDSWECPYCNKMNSTYTYKCIYCGYSIL